MRRFYDNVWVALEGVQLATMDYHNVWIVLGSFFGGECNLQPGTILDSVGMFGGVALTTVEDIQWGSEWQTRRK